MRLLWSELLALGALDAILERSLVLRESRTALLGETLTAVELIGALLPPCCLIQDKLGLASRFPTLSLINDACFALAFFLARICLGALDSMRFFRAIVRHRQDAPMGLLLVVRSNSDDDLDVTRSGTSLKFACSSCSSQYAAGNLALNGLNWFWFSKIFQKLVRTIGGGGAEKNNGRAPKGSSGVKRR